MNLLIFTLIIPKYHRKISGFINKLKTRKMHSMTTWNYFTFVNLFFIRSFTRQSRENVHLHRLHLKVLPHCSSLWSYFTLSLCECEHLLVSVCTCGSVMDTCLLDSHSIYSMVQGAATVLLCGTLSPVCLNLHGINRLPWISFFNSTVEKVWEWYPAVYSC